MEIAAGVGALRPASPSFVCPAGDEALTPRWLTLAGSTTAARRDDAEPEHPRRRLAFRSDGTYSLPGVVRVNARSSRSGVRHRCSGRVVFPRSGRPDLQARCRGQQDPEGGPAQRAKRRESNQRAALGCPGTTPKGVEGAVTVPFLDRQWSLVPEARALSHYSGDQRGKGLISRT